MSTVPDTRTVQTLDVPLGPGRQTLRAALVSAGPDEPATLVLSIGFGDGTAFLRPSWGGPPMRVPAEMLPELVDALQRLQGPEEPEAA